MRILVTGVAGFIGSHLAERLLHDGHQVLGIDNFNDFYDPEIKRRNVVPLESNPDFECVTGDILDTKLLKSTFGRFRPERVTHLAAMAGVRPSVEDPGYYQKVNLEGTFNLLERCRYDGVGHFVFASSSSVYGERQRVPFSEEDPVDEPISPYAATKKAGELVCYTYHHLFGIAVHCLRFFTVYGPRQRPEMAIHKFARLIRDGDELTLYGDGSSSRDYTYIDDIVDGVVASIQRVDGYRVYNIGDSKSVRLSDLVDKIGKALGKTPRVKYRTPQPGDVSLTSADISRAAAELDYAPAVDIDEGIRRFVEWGQF